ncbi:hypothetical protein GCM10009107_35630 [Ideonella azotifigens]|uniref:Uncharacterized protein n=1 Tax=Ideonella azotifigens TaxID=513160 RepID=A0ABN1K6Y4_9BURK
MPVTSSWTSPWGGALADETVAVVIQWLRGENGSCTGQAVGVDSQDSNRGKVKRPSIDPEGF